MYIFHNPQINKYIKSNVEIRIDYIAVWIDNYIIPILYYNYPQIGSKAYISMDINIQYPLDLYEKYEKEINSKVKHLERLFKAKHTHIELFGNFHTHPVGFGSFSGIDFNGCLRPEKDFFDEPMIGSNYLMYQDKKIVKGLVRKFDGEKYEYIDAKLSVGSFVEPIDCVVKSFFKEKMILNGKLHKNRKNTKRFIILNIYL